MRHNIKWLAPILIILLIAGCGGGPSIPAGLSGTVSFSGEPSSSLPDLSILLATTKLGTKRVAVMSRTTTSEPNQLIIHFNKKLNSREQEEILKSLHLKLNRRLYKRSDACTASPVGIPLSDALAQAQASPQILFAQYDYKLHKTADSSDPNYSLQWGLKLSKFNTAWDNYPGRDEVIVAVLDSGINLSSAEFSGRLVQLDGNPETDPSDNIWNASDGEDNRFSHGTNIAAIIAADPANGYGYAGAFWNSGPGSGIKIMPIRVLNRKGEAEFSIVSDGIHWAIDNGARIINLSLGVDETGISMPVTGLEEAFSYAADHGVTIICAVGNENTSRLNYPARLTTEYSNVITVGAVGHAAVRAYYSNYGAGLTVMAPGGDGSGTDYQRYIYNITFDKMVPQAEVLNIPFMGTSMSAPHVTALAAMLFSYGLTDPADIKEVIARSATDLGAEGYDSRYGYGLINAAAAFIVKDNLVNITAATIVLRNTVTLGEQTLNPDTNGYYHFPNAPAGTYELTASLPLSGGYRYFRTYPLTISGSMRKNIVLQLVPDSM
jgi:hypothetical protein